MVEKVKRKSEDDEDEVPEGETSYEVFVDQLHLQLVGDENYKTENAF